MVKHGEELKKKINDLGSGATPCPRTPQEWQEAIDLVAQWKAYQDLRDTMKAEFRDQLDKTPLGQRYDEVFKDKKKATKAAEAALQACNPPQSVMGDNLDIRQVIQQQLERMADVEKHLAGIIVLAVTDCPDCKRERQRVNTPGPK
jgi:hypothetical protein